MFKEKTKAPISTQRQAQPVHSISAKRGCLKQQGLPSVHSVKPNQYTTSVPKEVVLTKTKATIITQRKAQPVHNFSAKRGCFKKNKASMSTQHQTQPIHNISSKRGC